MLYLAIMPTDDYEWMSVSKSEAESRQAVFEGFNAGLMRQFELQDHKEITTYEHLEKRLKQYYRNVFKGNVSIDSLETKYPIFIIEMIEKECYRDGHKVPKKIHEI
jgi:hypothetical protein